MAKKAPTTEATADLAGEVEADKRLEKTLKEWIEAKEDPTRKLTQMAIAELADLEFELLKPGPLSRVDIDDPFEAEVRQQVKELEEGLKRRIQADLLKQADLILDDWLDREKMSNRAVPEISTAA